MNDSTNAFRIVVISVAAALVVPALFMDGMFADGMLYSTVAKNLAAGHGTWWDPHFTVFMHDHFHEQPPLVIWLQSFFFLFAPHSIYPERFYDLVLMAVNTWLIMRFWRTIFYGNADWQKLDWLPVLLFFIMPVTFWGFDNNIIEITMSAFVLASATAFFRAFVHEKKVRLNVFLGITWLIAATLCKGIQGGFTLVLPLLLWLAGIKLSFGKAFRATLVITGGFVLFYGIIFLFPAVRHAYVVWFNQRIVTTFSGVNNTSGSRFHMLFELLLDVLPPAGFLAFATLLSRQWPVKNLAAEERKNLVFILLLALAGSLPLMVTKEQRGFYLVTALPFYAVFFAILCAPAFVMRVKKIGAAAGKLILSAGILILCATIVATFIFAGKPKRDAEKISDITAIGQVTGGNTILGCDRAMVTDYAVVSYCARLYNISITDDTTMSGISYKISFSSQTPTGFSPVNVKTKEIFLFRKN
ncbi:MAG TPA: hypothetical protein VFU15_17450 [Bacteroidia bacterium]|nr:hypothetical protein [Bacteroidia bacterium]